MDARQPGDGGARDASQDSRPGRKDAHVAVDGGTPSLVSLAISGPGSPDAATTPKLVPAFSPDVHDYYARCAAGDNHVTVSLEASTGSLSLLVQPTTSPARPSQVLNLELRENQAIVALATDGVSTTEYWVRCLPTDFPSFEWTPHPEAGTPTPGYYLVSNTPSGATSSTSFAIVFDPNGVPVWYAREPRSAVSDVDTLLPNVISYALGQGFDTPGQPFELRWLSPLSTTLLTPLLPMAYSHDLRALPNGHFLVLSYLATDGYDLTGLEIALPDGGTKALGRGATIQDCGVLEVTPDGAVVWSWRLTDHFDPARTSTSPVFAGDTVDVFHCNSVDVDPANGDLLVSARNMNSIFYVERSTGNVVWKMGGKASSLDDAAYVAVDDPFIWQHDARLLPGWSNSCGGAHGKISLFDDETNGTKHARGVVYDVVVESGGDSGVVGDGGCSDASVSDAGGTGFAKVQWQYAGTARSAYEGSFRISADDSRVIGWGALEGPRSGLAFTEVDDAARDLLDLSFVRYSYSYRAIKVPLGAFDLEVLRHTAGLP